MTSDDLAKCREVAQFWREFHARNRIWLGAVTAQVIDDLCGEVERLTTQNGIANANRIVLEATIESLREACGIAEARAQYAEDCAIVAERKP